MTPHAAAIDYARTHRKSALEGLKRFVSFPSISAHPNRRADIRQCASWLVEHLTSIGMRRSRLIETGGSPIVSAEWRGAPNQPTLLIYGHYDVQPVDPLDEWQSDPFAPVVRDGYMYGRGASDDKGQLWTHVAALEAWLRSTGSMPLNVRCLFEGEEEIGSRHLMQFLKSRPREARADFAVISDMTMPSAGRPALTYALRGSLAFEITVEGNEPLHALCCMPVSCEARLADGTTFVPPWAR